MLVHGTSAHTGWWHGIVPALAGRHDVVALDLSGHGDSGRRARYSMAGWSAEVLAVVAALRLDRPVLVGHSVGGLVAAGAAARAPEAVSGLVLLDSIPEEPARPPGPPPAPSRPRGTRVFPDIAAAVAAYRLAPPQDVGDPAALAYVAGRSVRPVPGGVGWKVDGAIFDVVLRPGLTDSLDGVTCPVSVVRGERSALVGPDAAAALARRWGRPVPQHTVAGAGHHLMLDDVAGTRRALLTALDDVLTASDGFVHR
ncbi:alpha/beta fold hydrolase [Geodermatophilus sp. SYSU D01119]